MVSHICFPYFWCFVAVFAEPYTVSDANGLGILWEGVGAISGGGATTKLLMDYSPEVASDILDYMFKPNYGLNLQILKVELGSDTDATEGAEPSHIHFPGDQNFDRGYEWWLMKEARKRNPDLKLYALPWGWPGWLDPQASAGQKGESAFHDVNLTTTYTLSWLLGAKQHHGLTIDYVGQWNERDAPPDYVQALKHAVAGAKLLEGKTQVLNRLEHYPGSTEVPDPQGCEQFRDSQKSEVGARWVDEEGSIFDGRSARCLARVVNRMYISKCFTATFQWHLISSFYDYLPWARCGVAVANTPWSGAYEITSPTWALAHTSQFNPVGWSYAAHGNGVHMLTHGGSMVARIAPEGTDFSIVIEKMSSGNSGCARGDNPESVSTEEVVVIQLEGSFLQAALARGSLQVWYSNLASGNGFRDNPPDSQLFVNKEPLSVSGDGLVTLEVGPDEIFTLTTLTTGAKGQAQPPSPAPLGLPYFQDFDDETLSAPPRLWYDQMGSWEIQQSPYNDGRGNVMRQVVPVWPICWGYSCNGPTTFFGPSDLHGDVNISLDVYLESAAEFSIYPQGRGDFEFHGLHLDPRTGWKFGLEGQLGHGVVGFETGRWHTVSLRVARGTMSATLDGQFLGKANLPKSTLDCSATIAIEEQSESQHADLSAGGDSDDLCSRGRDDDKGFNLKVVLSEYVFASIDNFQVTPSVLSYLQRQLPTQVQQLRGSI